MMTAVEYRAKAFESQKWADNVRDPEFKQAFANLAREWTALARSADIQAQLEIAVARDVD